MARLLPNRPETAVSADSEPRVIGLESEDAEELIAALSSETARELLATLHEEPAAPSELTDQVDTSLQNVQYHLGNLQDAGAIEGIDTVYSEKGREMTVYAPADEPLVVVAGGQNETAGLRSILTGLVGGIGALAILGALLNYATGNGFLGMAQQRGGDVGTMTGGAADATSTGFPLDLAAPGTIFFLGGLTVLLVGMLLIARRA